MHKDVYEYLVESGISCEYMEKEKQIKIFIQTEGNQYELRMKFPQYYPYEFPEIYIEDQKELCIPHLYTDNKLCLYDTNEVLPNPERYREEALESVRRAKDLLVSSEKQENIIDYQIEAISFWDAKATGKIDYLGSGNTDTHLLWSCEWLDDWFVVADTQDKIEEFFDNSYGLQKPKNAIFKKALFINIGISVLVHLYTIQDMDYNFEYNDIQFEQPEQLNKEVPQFDEHFVEQIKQIDGVENVDIQKTVWAGIDFDETALEGFMKIQYEDSRYKSKGQSYEQMIEALKGYADAGDYGCYITTLPDDRVLEEYNAEHSDTPIDMEAFKRGETAIAGKDTEYNAPNTALVGETLTLTADSTDGKATDFKIGGAFYYDDYDNTLSEGIGRRKDIQIVPNIIFVSEAGMERLTKEPIISAIGVDIKNFNDLERIDSELQAINSTLTGSEWQLRSSVNQKELFEQMNYSLSLLGNGAAILLIVIGLINFVNVMLTGVVARKNEFAIMESIGTTKKQIMKILTLEGGIYALISTLLIMTFGNAFLMLVADAVPHMANYAVFKYPVALVIGLIAAIFVICLSVPAIVHKATSDETVIERLHNFEN